MMLEFQRDAPRSDRPDPYRFGYEQGMASARRTWADLADAAARKADDIIDAARTVSDTSLRAQINARFREVKQCYDVALKSARPGLEGRYVVQLTIAESGSVTSATIKTDTVREPSLAACVISKIRAWRFTVAPGTGPTTISYPIIFRASTR